MFPFGGAQEEQINQSQNQDLEDTELSRMIGKTDGLFLIEAGFQAVSEAIIATLGGSMQQWMQLSIEDKLL